MNKDEERSFQDFLLDQAKSPNTVTCKQIIYQQYPIFHDENF